MDTDAASEQLGAFFDWLWHDTHGYVYIPTEDPKLTPAMAWKRQSFEWPRQRSAVVKFALKADATGLNVYSSPAIYSDPRQAGRREAFLGSWTLWMDNDSGTPMDWSEAEVPEPDLTLQSSLPGNEHMYWQLDEFLTNATTLEDRNRAMAYQYKADTSGWDANQILRPPGTLNKIQLGSSKARKTDEPVTVIAWFEGAHAIDEFGAVVSAKQQVANSILKAELPDLQDVIALARWTPELWNKFRRTKVELETDDAKRRGGRSAAMQELAYMAAEQGWTNEQIMVVLKNADDRWEKYVNRYDSDRHYLDILNRARAKIGDLGPGEITFAGLIGDADDPASEVQLVYGWGEFVASDFHVDWLLQGLLSQGGIGIATGYPGAGKTQFAIQLGAHLALGYQDFLGWTNMDGKKKVMLLSLEMSANPLNLFLSTIDGSYADKRTLDQNFKVVPLGQPLPLDSEAGQKFLNSQLAEHMPDILIIDSMQKIIGREMTDELAVKEVMHYLSAVRAKFGCSMLLVHHNRKKSNDAQKKQIDLSDMYGSTYIAADVDFVISLSKLNDLNVQVSTLKNRLGPEHEAFEIVRDEHLTYHLAMQDFDGLSND